MEIIDTKIINPKSAKGKIRKRYDIIIKAISRSNAWHALYLIKYGTLGFLTTAANNIKNKSRLLKAPNPPYRSVLSIKLIGNKR